MLFEVPYNFNKSLISFYKQHSSFINFLFLPPYKEDSTNTRTYVETKKKGYCYMPQSRDEYEDHILQIKASGLKFVVLWQVPNNIISQETLNYYYDLGASGFIVANDQNAKIIKDFNANLLVVCSLVQRLCENILKKDLRYYDYILLYYPFNRSIDALKQLTHLKDKIILMPNTLCHIDCPSLHHWFPSKNRPFIQERDCMVLKDIEKYVKKSGFISPEHLYLFDNYVGGYKLQGREYTTELLKHICQIYFKRKSPKKLLDTMLGDDLSSQLQKKIDSMSPEEYYNVNTQKIINIL